ncbi:hypothetical protein [Endozoicomonas sp.]|uniref:hypothetical protein n=1 Tax=Endozoicomonas sp. TaxID=1892382 RepID=UPI00383B6A7F
MQPFFLPERNNIYFNIVPLSYLIIRPSKPDNKSVPKINSPKTSSKIIPFTVSPTTSQPKYAGLLNFYNIYNSSNQKTKAAHTPTDQTKPSDKSLFDHSPQKITPVFSNLTTFTLNTELPPDLQLKLNGIKEDCTSDEEIVEILNGHGTLYNRLIIFLIKFNKFIIKERYTPQKIKKIESAINVLLTKGKVNLTEALGRDLNHLEDNYLKGDWRPSKEDLLFFKKDSQNKKRQLDIGEFHPK